MNRLGVGRANRMGIVDDPALHTLAQRIAIARDERDGGDSSTGPVECTSPGGTTDSTGARPPILVGITGSVAVGKSTLAAGVASVLRDNGRVVEVVSTDGFLWPNEELNRLGLAMRKGFPESYDRDGLASLLRAIAARGCGGMVIPIYDHFRYDVSPTERHVLTRADVVVIEGLCLLGPGADCAIGPIAEPLDLTIYVDADAADIEAWHRARFVANARRAAAEPGGFWDLFSGFDDASLDTAAAYTWDEINAENLRSHVLPGRGDADIVVTKAADHSIVGIHPNPEH